MQYQTPRHIFAFTEPWQANIHHLQYFYQIKQTWNTHNLSHILLVSQKGKNPTKTLTKPIWKQAKMFVISNAQQSFPSQNPQLPSLSSLLQNEAYHLSTHSYNFLHIKNLLSIKHSLLLFANSWFINQLIINLVSSFTSRYIFLFFPNVGIPIIHEMGFVKYYKISKNFQNPHSKIKNFIHTSKIQRYPPTNIKKVLIFWGFAYTCWEMESWATL